MNTPRAVHRRETLNALYLADPYSGSAWGAINAFTEYADHHARAASPGRGVRAILGT